MKGLPKIIYVMGAPGSGKGTQATLLTEKIGYHQFSTGSAFREVSHQPTELGKKIKDLIDNGILCPPELAAEVVINAISDQLKSGNGLVFDGTPRTVEESVIVDEYFAKNGYGRPLAIYLEVSREEMIARNSKRKFCLHVPKDFPVITPEDEQKCVAQGGVVGTRPDDNPATFTTRWNEFQERTYPVIEKYMKEGILQKVNGRPSIPEVHQAVMNIINQHNAA